MSVYNAGPTLRDTLDSVLTQERVALEFIVVNDGSTDETSAILACAAARDPRVRVITQDNTGLTQALIVGCAAARAPLIARQDAGDRSLPGRITAQVSRFSEEPDLVMLACGTYFLGPYGELLDLVLKSDADMALGLSMLDLKTISGPPHHGSVMFRRDAYEAVGGYRSTFRFAQDLDLWMRLYEVGRCGAVASAYYEAMLTPGAISSKHRTEQVATAKVILECARARRCGEHELPLLEAFGAREFPTVQDSAIAKRLTDARFHYHIASRLMPRDIEAARRHLIIALRHFPPHLPATMRLISLGFRK